MFIMHSKMIAVQTVEYYYSIIFLFKKYMDVQWLKTKITHSKG